MLSFLQNQPFAVEAFFEHSLVLSFAVPKEQIQNLVPACLKLDTFNDQWAFVAVAMVQTKDLRPKGFPKLLGNDFFLIGYRVFVRYINKAGKRLRGLYILKSETDKKKMEIFGNIFTHYQYSTTDIHREKKDGIVRILSHASAFKVSVRDNEKELIALPPNSPFSDWKEARRFAGPLPFTFSFNPVTNQVLIVEGVREHWIPEPVEVLDYNISFLEKMQLTGIQLASAFSISNIPYHWKKGKLEQWTAV